MAYKFQRGDATYSGSLTIDEDLSVTEAITGTTSITAGTSFIIGSADLNEADMEKIDGITNGTAAASKAIVLDADKGITGISTLTASYFKGDGSALTGISSDNVDVADTTSDLNYQLVAVTASGDGVSLVTMNTAAQRVTINGSTGKMILDGPGIQIGAADITEAEFEFLDGATAGSVVNSNEHSSACPNPQIEALPITSAKSSNNSEFQHLSFISLTAFSVPDLQGVH